MKRIRLPSRSPWLSASLLPRIQSPPRTRAPSRSASATRKPGPIGPDVSLWEAVPRSGSHTGVQQAPISHGDSKEPSKT
jgi:hypothetical protein